MVGDAYGALKHIGEVGLHFVLRREEPPTSPHDSRHDSRGVSLLGLGGGAPAAAPSEACSALAGAAARRSVDLQRVVGRRVRPRDSRLAAARARRLAAAAAGPGAADWLGRPDPCVAVWGTLASAASCPREAARSPRRRRRRGLAAAVVLVRAAAAAAGAAAAAARRAHARPRTPAPRRSVAPRGAPFDALPSVLQHGTHIKCVVALITQGINAQQTVANAVAPALVDLQELINAEAALLLRRYQRRARFAAPRVGRAAGGVPRRARRARGADGAGGGGGAALAVAASQRAEYRDHHADRAARARAPRRRVMSCKSAKDRTSMAVTAEQVRWLVERHGLDADEAPACVDEMRRARLPLAEHAQERLEGDVRLQLDPAAAAARAARCAPQPRDVQAVSNAAESST